MIFIFGFRRYQYFQERLHVVFQCGSRGRPTADSNQQAQAAGDQYYARLQRASGTRPRLWDVCTDSSVRWWEVTKMGGVVAGAGRKAGGGAEYWDNVMPLSASRVANADKSGDLPSSFRSSSSSSSSTRGSSHSVSSRILQRFCRLGATSTSSTTPRGDKRLKHTPPRPVSSMRLAVLVAMPSERYPIYDNNRDSACGQRGTLGYELGLYEVPWDSDDADHT